MFSITCLQRIILREVRQRDVVSWRNAIRAAIVMLAEAGF